MLRNYDDRHYVVLLHQDQTVQESHSSGKLKALCKVKELTRKLKRNVKAVLIHTLYLPPLTYHSSKEGCW